MIRVMYINNDGAGFADYVEVEEGTTVSDFFCKKIPGGNTSDYLIRVNRLPVTADQVLEAGARISISPTKIAGAR